MQCCRPRPPREPRRARSSRARLGFLLCLAIPFAGCSSSDESEPAPSTTGSQDGATTATMRGFEVIYSLLAMEEQREVLEAPAQPKQDLFQPRRGGDGADFSHLPAVIVTPNTRLRYRLPAAHPDAELRFSLAPAMNAYHANASILVEATWNGEPCFETTLNCAKETPAEERRWRYFSIPIPTGGTLEIQTTYQGPRKASPEMGIGRLQVGVPFEAPRVTSAPGRPNVVLVVIDTLRADRLSCYGAGSPTSPVIDALAARGVRFARAYSSAPWTLPGTASILTGKAPPEHGIGVSASFYLSDGLESLAEPFQRAGVTTGAFTCNPLIAEGRNFDQGFETFQNYRWVRASAIHDQVVQWLDDHAQHRFFLYLHTVDPHDPYEPTPESAARFAGEAPPGFLPLELRPEMTQFYSEDGYDEEILQASNAHQFKLYDAEVHDVDQALGRVVDKLEQLGILDQTIIAVTSDHGEEFLEHGWVGHNSQLYDEQVHVPLVIAGPGIPSGEVAEARIENRLLYRTLLEAAGIEGGPRTEPYLLERGPDGELAGGMREQPVYLVNGPSKRADYGTRTLVDMRNVRAMIQGKWRLNVGTPLDSKLPRIALLFDLDADPDCLVDVSAQHPERVQSMKVALEKWFQAGRKRQPPMVPSTEGTLELLRANGYIGD